MFAVVLMFLALIILDKSLTMEVMLIIVGLSCITSAITWPIADGKQWLILGLIYEALFIILLFVSLIIDGLIRGLMDWISFTLCFVFVFTIAIICLIPSMVLAFVGYHLFNKNITNKE